MPIYIEFPSHSTPEMIKKKKLYVLLFLICLYVLKYVGFTGKPGPPDKVHLTRFGIFWWQTCGSMYYLQMPSPLEVI